jgi:bifunctional non-homologous end joining protein LigD
MFATLVDKAFDDKDWIYEIKWDGYRAVAELQNKKIKLYSRNGLSFSEKFSVIAEALAEIKHDAVLDGEIVLLDEKGKPSFQKLQHYEDNTDLPLVYYVFDILFLKKKDIRHLSLLQRKELLNEFLSKNKNDVIRYCDHIVETGKAMFKVAVEKNLEGIIAKKIDSEYSCGIRSKDWLKIKHQNSREGIIVGYTEPRNSRKYFGALVLAQYAGDELQYMGHTGTGFDQQGLKDLWNEMQALIINKSPFKEKVKVNAPVTWIKPKLVCQLSFTEVTEDGLLRHPVYLGLRNDKKFTQVKKTTEEPEQVEIIKKINKMENENELVINKRKVPLSNISKIYWPEENYTKGDMIEYYKNIAPYILPYLKNRPLSLKRNPNGIIDAGFFQKDAGEKAPSWIKKVNVHSESNDKTIHYIMCNDAASLIYIANLGCIEMNPWFSTSLKINKPTYMVIDIDPSEKNTFDEVTETALVVKSILDKAGAASFCKTSGATGMHVYVPMGNKYPFEQVKDFAHIIASLTSEQLPETTTLTRSLAKRADNKIYVDYLQNRRGQTLACAYSLRPKPNAPVSTPLHWDEVKTGLHPSQFNMMNIQKRLSKTGDIFSPVLGKGVDLNKCLKLLSK